MFYSSVTMGCWCWCCLLLVGVLCSLVDIGGIQMSCTSGFLSLSSVLHTLPCSVPTPCRWRSLCQCKHHPCVTDKLSKSSIRGLWINVLNSCIHSKQWTGNANERTNRQGFKILYRFFGLYIWGWKEMKPYDSFLWVLC